MFRAVKRSVGKDLEDAINASSYGTDYKCFSPFSYSPEFKIPVSGQKNLTSRSVEGIWQGLKIINGQTDFSLFQQKPRKRKGEVQGHLFGDETLNLLEARRRIYAPSYYFYLEKYVPDKIKGSVISRALEKGSVTFYDTGENLDIQSPESLSHSVFLIEYFNGYFNQNVNRVKRQIDSFYSQQEVPNETLAEPLARVIAWNQSASDLDKKLLKHFLENQVFSENRVDVFKERYYKEILRELREN
jgi:hypothetical protein